LTTSDGSARKRTPGDERKLLAFFQANPDKPVNIHELAAAIGSDAKNLSRRVRALRERGWNILSKSDRPDLRPDEYVFPGGQSQGPNRRKILSSRVKAEILRRDNYICQSCGLAAGDTDPDSGRLVVLQVHHIDDTLTGAGLNAPENLRTRCRTCNEGARHFDAPPPEFLKIKGLLRAANENVRRQVYEYLLRQFGETGPGGGMIHRDRH
jgi:hypothetical protein